MHRLGGLQGSVASFARAVRFALFAVACVATQSLVTFRSLAQAPAAVDAAEHATTLTLTISEPSVLVTIDAVVQGVTPLEAPLELAPGRHRLELFKQGFQRIVRDLEVSPGAQSLSFELVAEGASGKLSVGASLLPAALILDGNEVGPLPWTGDAAPGEHLLSARSADAEGPDLNVTVRTGETTVATLSLHVRTARLRIEAPDASISLDSKWLAVGSWSGEASPGKHRIHLQRVGFPAKEFDVSLAPGEEWTLPNVAWDAAPALPGEAKPVAWAGVYAQLGLFGLFGSKPTDEIKQDCPAARVNPGRCHWHPPAGGGLGVRVGYSFGWVAVEATVTGQADAWYERTQYQTAETAQESDFYGPPRTERYTFLRYGTAVALGARLLTPTHYIRGTLGLSAGVLQRWERYFRVATTVSKLATPLGGAMIPDARTDSSDVASSACPLLLADVGVLLGDTPGLKLHLGLVLEASFGGDAHVSSTHAVLGRDPSTGQSVPFGSGPVDSNRSAPRAGSGAGGSWVAA